MTVRLLPLCAIVRAAHPLGPGAGPWDVEAPEAHGLASEALQATKEYVFGQSHPPLTHRDCLVIIKDGALVFEEYSSDKYNVTGHQAYSMTKTLGAFIAGYAATHAGLDIDADITAAYGVKSPKKYAVTARQIMSQALAGADGPGEEWKYDAVGIEWINRMTEVIPAATGKNASEIWKEQFEARLGFDSLTFNDTDSVWATGSVGTCRDYARLGQLMLNKGSWKDVDEPIVSEEYIKQMSTPQTKYEPYTNYSNPCYGLLTWLTDVGKVGADMPRPCKSPSGTETPFPLGSPSDIYFGGGMLGQIIMVVPSHNMVAVTMGRDKTANDVPVWISEGLCKNKVFEDCGDKAQVLV